MVKKLYKYEFFAWLRIMPIVYGILLFASISFRLTNFFEDNRFFSLLYTSAFLIYFVSLAVCLVAPMVFGITRFYRNLFTGEGYLTLTLPVAPATHIWVKVLTASVFSTISVIIVIVSGVISGFLNTVLPLVGFSQFVDVYLDSIVFLFFFELLPYLVVTCISSHLLYCFCICVGQMFRKNRILAAVGTYFALQLALQILSTIGSILLMSAYDAGANISSATASSSGSLWGATIWSFLTGLFYYLVSHHIIAKKLNLE